MARLQPPVAVWPQASEGPRGSGIKGSIRLSRPALPFQEDQPGPQVGSGHGWPWGTSTMRWPPWHLAVVKSTQTLPSSQQPSAAPTPQLLWRGGQMLVPDSREVCGGGGLCAHMCVCPGVSRAVARGRGPPPPGLVWPGQTTLWSWRVWMCPLAPASSEGQGHSVQGTHTHWHSPTP